MEGTKKIKSTSFHQYSWNSEVETTWISLIGWHHKTSNNYLPIYSLEKLCFTVLITLFNFQNFGNKQPPKIQPDRDLQPLLQVHFSNQVPEIKISHVKTIKRKKMFPSQPTGEQPLYCRRCQSESSRAWALPCSGGIPRESERIPTRRIEQTIKKITFQG